LKNLFFNTSGVTKINVTNYAAHNFVSSANGAEYEKWINSAEGAKYDNQGQARSEAERVAPGNIKEVRIRPEGA
jgi:hypothetical protein